MAFIKDGKLIRRCYKCQITSDIIHFQKRKNTKNGKYYTHNICVPCFQEYQHYFRILRYKSNKKESIAAARQWNIENREKINRRNRIKNKFFKDCLEAI